MKKINKCVICGNRLKEFLNIGHHPCADTFLKRRIDAINLKKYPLVVGFCTCNHLTSINKVSPNERYKKNDYSYTSNNSPVSISHFYEIAKKIIKDYKINNHNKVIEIGSNDGTFLKNIKDLSGAKVLGIDPSDNMCELASKKGIKTLNIFFKNKNVKKISKKYGKYDILYGANVFNHIENPFDFLRACKKLVKKLGLIILEVPDLDSLFKSVGFDTIYHEHRQYYSKQSILKLFKKTDINLIKIEKIDYMSGSLRIFAINEKFKRNFRNKPKLKISKKKFDIFKSRIFLVKEKILEFVKKNKSNNKIIVGLGAATKGNTLLNFCGLNYKDILCILEKSPHKIGKYMPGSGIKILDEKNITKYDAAIILPWNITKHLHKKFLQKTKISYTSIAKVVGNIK